MEAADGAAAADVFLEAAVDEAAGREGLKPADALLRFGTDMERLMLARVLVTPLVTPLATPRPAPPRLAPAGRVVWGAGRLLVVAAAGFGLWVPLGARPLGPAGGFTAKLVSFNDVDSLAFLFCSSATGACSDDPAALLFPGISSCLAGAGNLLAGLPILLANRGSLLPGFGSWLVDRSAVTLPTSPKGSL